MHQRIYMFFINVEWVSATFINGLYCLWWINLISESGSVVFPDKRQSSGMLFTESTPLFLMSRIVTNLILMFHSIWINHTVCKQKGTIVPEGILPRLSFLTRFLPWKNRKKRLSEYYVNYREGDLMESLRWAW